jgi:hypothetical protein
MKRLIFLGSILGTLVALPVASLVVVITLVWLVRQWGAGPWVVWVVGLGMMGAAVAVIWRWWRLPVERRFRFSLRGMLVGITLIALWIGAVLGDFRQWSRKNWARWEVSYAGGGVEARPERPSEYSWHRDCLFQLTGCDPLWKPYEVYVNSDRVMSALLKSADELREIEVVYFVGPATDASLAQVDRFERFPKVWFCYVGSPSVSDGGLEHLRDCHNLRGMNLDGCTGITDAGLAHLVELDLDRLLLWNRGPKAMPITDAGLVHVGRMSSLEYLEIQVPVTDAGLRQLHGLEKLERLFLSGTQVTEKGYLELCKALPDCLIDWKGEHFPHVSQIERIEVWQREPSQGRIVTIAGSDRIAAVREWLDDYAARPGYLGGWLHIDSAGPSGASMTLRFEGKDRTIQEIPFGNGVYHKDEELYLPMLRSDEDGFRELLGVDSGDWHTGD